MINQDPIQLYLGTAMWGWTLPAKQCFALLDEFYALGGRAVDCATNYPINKKPHDFRAAENILHQWQSANAIDDLEIVMKIGSVNNMFTPEHNLSPSFLLLNADYYQNIFGNNLSCLMIHWDNRDQKEEINKSLQVLSKLQETGLKIGLSGIKHPDIYQELILENKLSSLPIQCKHNLIYSDLERYHPLHKYGDFIAYGINGGGVKLTQDYSQKATLLARGGDPTKFKSLIEALNKQLAVFKEAAANRIIPESMNQLGMIYAAYHPLIKGILLGVSKEKQLQDSWSWAEVIAKNDYRDLYASLVEVVRKHAIPS